MTTSTNTRTRIRKIIDRVAPFLVGFTIGFALTLAALAAWPSSSEAHTPNPVACEIAWDQAPPGEKWAAQQRCVAAQANHVRKHRIEVAVAKARRACLSYGWQLGYAMCDAIARVKPAWAGRWAYHELLDRESDGSTNAVNEGSGACGAFQRLKCPWRYYGGSSSPHDDRVYSDALTQTRNGVRYIVGRYGSPEAAVRFHDANNWY